MVFPVVMYGCESWTVKKAECRNWRFWTMMLEKTLESPLDCKGIQSVHSKGDQPWVFFGRNDAKAETAVLWPPHAKSWLTGKDSDAGRVWGQELNWISLGHTYVHFFGHHHLLPFHDFKVQPLSHFSIIFRRKKWQVIPVFLPGKFSMDRGAGGLQSMGSQRIRHDWVTECSPQHYYYHNFCQLFCFIFNILTNCILDHSSLFCFPIFLHIHIFLF